VAFNFRCLNPVQLAIDVGMNDFQYFLTTQLETSTRFGTGFSLKTPKAFANFSPGFEEREPWVTKEKI